MYQQNPDTQYSELYSSVAKSLNKFFKDDSSPQFQSLLADVLLQFAFKIYILSGMTKEEFASNFDVLKKHYDYIYDDYQKEKQDAPIFSESLKKAMEPFKGRDVADCLNDPDFYKSLLIHGGSSDEEAEKIMADIKSKCK